MSRSFNKVLCTTWPTTSIKRRYKNLANRRIRRHRRFIPNGRAYRKLYDQYSICDVKRCEFTKTQYYLRELEWAYEGIGDFESEEEIWRSVKKVWSK